MSLFAHLDELYTHGQTAYSYHAVSNNFECTSLHTTVAMCRCHLHVGITSTWDNAAIGQKMNQTFNHPRPLPVHSPAIQ